MSEIDVSMSAFYECIERENEQLKQENEKFKQKLEKIKDIMEENCKLCFDIDGFVKYDDCGICEAKKILQIIESEA